MQKEIKEYLQENFRNDYTLIGDKIVFTSIEKAKDFKEKVKEESFDYAFTRKKNILSLELMLVIDEEYIRKNYNLDDWRQELDLKNYLGEFNLRDYVYDSSIKEIKEKLNEELSKYPDDAYMQRPYYEETETFDIIHNEKRMETDEEVIERLLRIENINKKVRNSCY